MEPRKTDDDGKEFRFIRETVKEPSVKNLLLKRVLMVLIPAAAAGLVAAFVFAAALPAAEKVFGREEKERVQINTAAAASSSVSGEQDPVPSVTPTPEATPEATPEPTPEPEATPQPGPEEITAAEIYEKQQKEIEEAASGQEDAIVEVTGISSEMDYFNVSYQNEKLATGLLIAENASDYYILTEQRVIDGAEQIRIRFSDGSFADAALQKYDKGTGMAVVRVSADDISDKTKEGLKTAVFGNSYSLRRGQTVLAIGSPLGYNGSVSSGRITSLDNTVSLIDQRYHILTTDMLGTQGGSGILVNMSGELIGIIAQSINTESSEVVTAFGVSEVEDLIRKLSNGDSRAYAGIRGEDVTESISEQTGIPQGMLVMEVEADSPAMMGGIKQQDVITKVNETEIRNTWDFCRCISELSAEDTVTVTAMRKGVDAYEEIPFDLTLGEI